MQAVYSEALWAVLPSLCERAPKGFRPCSEGLRSKAPSEGLLTGVEAFLYEVMFLYKHYPTFKVSAYASISAACFRCRVIRLPMTATKTR